MAHISGDDRSQQLLLPEAVDDWVGSGNTVRFIDAFVDGLDLERAGFERVQANRTGRPGYDPADLLKLYLYGYLNRIRSSRRLETETHRNLEVIWLPRRLRPDFKTIADFRQFTKGRSRRTNDGGQERRGGTQVPGLRSHPQGFRFRTQRLHPGRALSRTSREYLVDFLMPHPLKRPWPASSRPVG